MTGLDFVCACRPFAVDLNSTAGALRWADEDALFECVRPTFGAAGRDRLALETLDLRTGPAFVATFFMGLLAALVLLLVLAAIDLRSNTVELATYKGMPR